MFAFTQIEITLKYCLHHVFLDSDYTVLIISSLNTQYEHIFCQYLLLKETDKEK